jgi:hypothetical protein
MKWAGSRWRQTGKRNKGGNRGGKGVGRGKSSSGRGRNTDGDYRDRKEREDKKDSTKACAGRYAAGVWLQWRINV